MCILNRHQFLQCVLYKKWRNMQYVLYRKWRNINMQTSLKKWLCITNTISPCMQQPFANIVAFFKRCVALLPNFKENPPMYVLNDFRNHSIPIGNVGCCFARSNLFLNYHSMVFNRVPSCWHIDWNMCFTFEGAYSCLQSV